MFKIYNAAWDHHSHCPDLFAVTASKHHTSLFLGFKVFCNLPAAQKKGKYWHLNRRNKHNFIVIWKKRKRKMLSRNRNRSSHYEIFRKTSFLKVLSKRLTYLWWNNFFSKVGSIRKVLTFCKTRYFSTSIC